MKGFLEAIRFLTIIPVRSGFDTDAEKSMRLAPVFFPVIGLGIGLMLSGINVLLSRVMNNQFGSGILIVIFLILITRGLHLDGLADTCDAFFSINNKTNMLKIMRDPHIGTMGVLGLLCIILLKLFFIAFLNPAIKNSALILMCVLSRYAMVFTLYKFNYARPEGKAKIFFSAVDHKTFFLAAAITLICSTALYAFSGLILCIAVTLCTFGIASYMAKKLNGLTGDTLGAINELTEILVLFLIVIITGYNHA